MAYTLSNMCAKKTWKQTILVQIINENVVTFFWDSEYHTVPDNRYMYYVYVN